MKRFILIIAVVLFTYQSAHAVYTGSALGTELDQCSTIDSTTISAAQWAGVGAASTYGIALMALADAAALQAVSNSFLEDGTIPLTANWDVGAYKITAANFIPDTAATANGELGHTGGAYSWFYNTDTMSLTNAANVWTFASSADTFAFTQSVAFGGITIPTTTSGDQALTVGKIGLKTDEDMIVIHGGANGEVTDEAGLSLIDHIVVPFDPEFWYDNITEHIVAITSLKDQAPHGITLVEWECEYLNGDPTTELDADLICDATPDWTDDAGATVMDVIDTTAGTSSADTGFDSATCANGNNLYIRMGADPVDSGEIVLCEFDVFYNED